MIIDTNTYKLSENNFIKDETIKKQIVIGHTSNSDMRHFMKWENRLNGKYTKTASFTIDFEGNIYQHFDPIYTSTFFENIEFNKKSIIILLENEGWLLKDVEKNQFINWIGHIYNRPDSVLEKKWRGYSHWAPYTSKQTESVLELTKNLCNEFLIPNVTIPHNTKLEKINNLNCVIYRSNLEKHYTDLSPAWNCEEFKYKLEQNEK